ncbi:MAG: hypothetical protein ACOX2X_04155 [Peptococcia bacterium]|jgi:hypothetical protein
MATIWKNHYKNQAITQQICEIVLNQEFNSLCEELLYLYQKEILNPEKEAFQDALYSILAQKDCTGQLDLQKQTVSYPL